MPNPNPKTPARPTPLYRIQNWAAYDQALVQRGSLTFWLSDDFEQTWQAAAAPQRGAQLVYSDHAMTLMLTLREVFHLTNRAVEGLVGSLFALLEIRLPVPDHTTVSRRAQHLSVALAPRAAGPLHVVMDSTGLKVYGEGEWKVRTHGASKRRTWRKLHLGVDPASGEIQAALLTANSCSDDAAAIALLPQIDAPLARFTADGSYDTHKVYDLLRTQAPDATVLIPPRPGARIWQHGNTHAAPLARDQNLRYIRRHGRAAWKRDSGYHERSLAETAMFRIKTIFGGALSARLLATQQTQALVRCAALNQMTQLGMPQSYKVA
jgi:hypothetical protein